MNHGRNKSKDKSNDISINCNQIIVKSLLKNRTYGKTNTTNDNIDNDGVISIHKYVNVKERLKSIENKINNNGAGPIYKYINVVKIINDKNNINTHKQINNNNDCGVHYVRTLLHQPFSTQHNCLANINHKYKLITRIIGNLYEECIYCKNNINCILLATIDEIAQYKIKCKQLKIIPNSKYGPFKKINQNINAYLSDDWTETDSDDDKIISERIRQTNNNKPLKKPNRIKRKPHLKCDMNSNTKCYYC